MLVAVLIGIMISIVIGVSLVPVIVDMTGNVTYGVIVNGTRIIRPAPAGLQALIGVLPYVFVAVILLGAVAWIGGQQ